MSQEPEDLPPELRSMLGRLRQAPRQLPGEVDQRAQERLAEYFTPGPPGGTGGGASLPKAGSGVGAGSAASKWVLVVAGSALVGAAAFLTPPSPPSSPPEPSGHAVVPAVAEAASAPAPGSPPPEPAASIPPGGGVPSPGQAPGSPPPPEPAARPSASAPAALSPPGSAAIDRARQPAAAPSAKGPAASVSEIELLGGARAALDRKDTEAAQQWLQEHRRLYPGGVLREEREALQVRTLTLLGKAREAAEAREKFLREHPESILEKTVRKQE